MFCLSGKVSSDKTQYWEIHRYNCHTRFGYWLSFLSRLEIVRRYNLNRDNYNRLADKVSYLVVRASLHEKMSGAIWEPRIRMFTSFSVQSNMYPFSRADRTSHTLRVLSVAGVHAVGVDLHHPSELAMKSRLPLGWLWPPKLSASDASWQSVKREQVSWVLPPLPLTSL